MKEPCKNTIFNLYIEDSIKDKLLKIETGPIIYINTLEEIEILLSGGLNEGVGFFEMESNLLKQCYHILCKHTHYPTSLIYDLMYSKLHAEISIILAIQRYQNNDFFSYEEYLLESKIYLDGFLDYAFSESLALTVEVEKDLKYTVTEKKEFLANTLKKLSTINKDLNSDGLEFVINNFPRDGKTNTILKAIKKSKTNYIGYDTEVGMVYIHIINIVYATYCIEHTLDKEREIVQNLSKISTSKKLEHIQINNFINNLIEFKKEVNKDQILQYIAMFYHENFIYGITNFEYIKKLFSILFQKEHHRLFLNELNINKIQKPLNNIFYYTRWEYYENMNEIMPFEKRLKEREEYLNHNFKDK